jgi:lysozyme
MTTVSTFLNSLLQVFSTFTLNIANGFLQIPITQMRSGSAFTDMLNAINYPDASGSYQLGQSYGTTNTLTGPKYTQAPVYTPGTTIPPKPFPTSQPGGYTVPLGLNPAGMYHLSAEGLRVLKVFEGLHQRAYTIGSQSYIGYGSKIAKFDPALYVSRDQADQMLAADVSAAEGVVKGAISGNLTQGQFDALVDFAYTVSTENFKSSDVVKKFNAGDIPGVATALAQSCYVQLNGIIARSLHLTARRTHNIQWVSMPVNPLPPT